MRESIFFLLYGRHPRLPTEAALGPPVDWNLCDLDAYNSLEVGRMGEAWQLAKVRLKAAQKRQKAGHDQRPVKFQAGDRVFVHMPAAKLERHTRHTS